MGWVEDKLKEPADFANFVPQLWDEMRDSIGRAISEFNAHTSDAADDFLAAKDCTAMGRYCRRISKGFGKLSIEVFLEEKGNLLKTSIVPHGPDRSVCEYRINADRSGAEFFIRDAEGTLVISPEKACQRALEDFIFPIQTDAGGND
jgi:hypothetical protein